MATLYSDQITQVQPPNYSPLKANEKGGKVRRDYFSFTGAGEADGSTIDLVNLPKGARVTNGYLAHTDFGASRVLDVGLIGADLNGNIDDTVGATVADDPDLFTSAQLDVSAAGLAVFAEDVASNFGYETAKEVILRGTITGGTLTAAKTLYGYVDYVVE